MRKYKYLYEKDKIRPSFQKSWVEKKKEKMHQKRKGFKPPFFRNNSQSYHQGKKKNLMPI
jgi:hypothetical protein